MTTNIYYIIQAPSQLAMPSKNVIEKKKKKKVKNCTDGYPHALE